MINTNCTIYIDAVSLLICEKPVDIKAEIYNQFLQSDYEYDQLRQGIANEYGDTDAEGEALAEIFDECPVEKIMEYISFERSDIEFDYGEAIETGDRSCCAFRINVHFDLDRFAEDHPEVKESFHYA